MTEEEIRIQMEEEERQRKQKYRMVLSQLSSVDSNVSSLQSSLMSLKTIIKTGLIVDNKIIDEEIHDNIIEACQKVSSNTSSAIGIIQSKI